MSPDKGANKNKGDQGKGAGKGQGQTTTAASPDPKGAPKSRARGPDWSHYDIDAQDFQAVHKMNPIGYKRGDFGIMKLTEGANDIDSSAAAQWELVSPVEIRGAFHYQRSGQGWQAQADHFLKVIKDRNYDFHIYGLDLEGGNNTYDDNFFKDTRQIVDYWQAKEPKKMVMLYCNASTYQDNLYPRIKRLYPADGVQWLDKVPLWLARYNPDDRAGNGAPKALKQRSTWDIWQYDKNGARDNYGARDLNVYNGSKEDMLAWLAAGSPLIQAGIVTPETVIA